MQVVRAEGLDIAYVRRGVGPPLVFVHGAGDDSRIWQPQLAALADEFTVVACDEPGAGAIVRRACGIRPRRLRELPRRADSRLWS
jgi:pimeloyl-ACP methyl ester carboxylesterase